MARVRNQWEDSNACKRAKKWRYAMRCKMVAWLHGGPFACLSLHGEHESVLARPTFDWECARLPRKRAAWAFTHGKLVPCHGMRGQTIAFLSSRKKLYFHTFLGNCNTSKIPSYDRTLSRHNRTFLGNISFNFNRSHAKSRRRSDCILAHGMEGSCTSPYHGNDTKRHVSGNPRGTLRWSQARKWCLVLRLLSFWRHLMCLLYNANNTPCGQTQGTSKHYQTIFSSPQDRVRSRRTHVFPLSCVFIESLCVAGPRVLFY